MLQNKKLIWIILPLGILLSLGIGVGIRHIKETVFSGKSVGIEWQLYSDEEYGFEIKYPSQWRIKTKGLVEAGQVSFVNWDEEKDEKAAYEGLPNNGAVINVIPWKDSTLEEMNQMILQVLSAGLGKLISESEFKIQGYPARKFIYTSDINKARIIDYLIQKDDMVFEISMFIPEEADLDVKTSILSIYDYAFSSFKIH